jgi:hypothetical protein
MNRRTSGGEAAARERNESRRIGGEVSLDKLVQWNFVDVSPRLITPHR